MLPLACELNKTDLTPRSVDLEQTKSRLKNGEDFAGIGEQTHSAVGGYGETKGISPRHNANLNTCLPAQYGYDSTHLVTSETDNSGYAAGSTSYFPDGKLQTVTDAVGNLTQYNYDVPNRTTTVTNPDGGTVVTVTDASTKSSRRR